MARRIGVGTDAVPDGGDRVPRAERDQRPATSSLLFNAKISSLGDTLAAAGMQRAAIGNADTTLTPALDADYRRWAPLALTDSSGIVPAGDVVVVVARTGSGRAVRLAARTRTA